MRQTGSRNTLVKINYDLIGQLAGIAGDTAKQYTHRGEYDPRNLDSDLRWINGRRATKGLPLIGIPTTSEPVVQSDELDAVFVPGPPPSSLRCYDPMTGGYRNDPMTGDLAFRR